MFFCSFKSWIACCLWSKVACADSMCAVCNCSVSACFLARTANRLLSSVPVITHTARAPPHQHQQISNHSQPSRHVAHEYTGHRSTELQRFPFPPHNCRIEVERTHFSSAVFARCTRFFVQSPCAINVGCGSLFEDPDAEAEVDAAAVVLAISSTRMVG